MKKILNVCVFLMLCLFSFNCKVFAEEIRKELIMDDYIKVIPSSGNIFQSIFPYYKDSNGNFIYTLNASSFNNNGDTYLSYDEKDFNGLSEKDKYKIGLIIEYGYGYGEHTEKKWYEVCQIMILRIYYPNHKFIFETGFNGEEIEDKYEKEFNEMEELIDDHIDDINVNYNDKLIIPELNDLFTINSSSYEYSFNNGYEALNIKNDGVISYTRKPLNRFNDSIKYYISDKGGYIVPGNTNLLSNTVNVNVLKSNVTFSLIDNSSSYSSERNVKNTCYEFKLDDYVKNFCFDDKSSIILENMPQGLYSFRQTSVGIGYEFDGEYHSIPIYGDTSNIKLIIKEIVNTFYVQHNYCVDDVCQPLIDIKYGLYDINKNRITTLISDNNGKVHYELGYGTYLLEQETFLQGYSVSAPIQFIIANSNDLYSFKLKNKLFEETTVIPGEINKDNEDIDNKLDNNDEDSNLKDNFENNNENNDENNDNDKGNNNDNDNVNDSLNNSINDKNIVIIDKDNNLNNVIDDEVVIDSILDDEIENNEFDSFVVSSDYYDQIIENPDTGCFINWVYGLGFILLFNLVILLAIKVF